MLFWALPPLLLNDNGEVGDPKGGGGSDVRELVMFTMFCRGLAFLPAPKAKSGEGPNPAAGFGRGVIGGDAGSSDLLSSS